MTTAPQKSSLVNWLGYLAITFLLLLPLAVLTVRSGAWQQGLGLYALACLGATLCLTIAILLLMLPRFAAHRSAIRWRALLCLPGALLMASLLMGGKNIPAIHDITTDTQNPPQFDIVLTLRSETDNSLDIDPKVIAIQGKAYPDLTTIVTTGTIETSFDLALQTAQSLGWEVVRKDLNAGFIEAVATTGIMAFKDDVVVRLRTRAGETLIDLRSASRVGRSDLGANAKRINRFTEAYLAADNAATRAK